MYEIEKRWYEGIRAGQSGGRGAASFREIRRWRVLFSPSSPPPQKSGSFPCFRLSQRFRLFLGDSPRPPLCTSEWDRKKRARESAREAHHVATRRVTGGSERNSPPPPKQRRSPLLSRSLSLSLLPPPKTQSHPASSPSLATRALAGSFSPRPAGGHALLRLQQKLAKARAEKNQP
jgi:hypothetical protein